jgi:photosystem II stability/assembly factor-like uncharacterized protein
VTASLSAGRSLAIAAIAASSAVFSFQWTPLTSGVEARLRGISVVSTRVAWASGANGTILRTTDEGRTWRRLSIPETNGLDFRDIDAVGESTAWVLSIGAGEASRIYKTVDAGTHWTQQFVNHDPKAFLDAMAFWDAKHGIAVSDSVDGRFVILQTHDGGSTWTRVPADVLPAALPNEGAFAASGTNVAVLAPNHVWIGTGAGPVSRVLHSPDGGRSWTIAKTPLATSPSAGIFSVAFRDSLHGIVVGGDYRKESDAIDNAATTADGGATWTLTKGLSGFRSVVAYVPGSSSAIAIGPAGADRSEDDGRTWTAMAGPGYHAFAFPRVERATTGFAVGEGGRVGRLDLH